MSQVIVITGASSCFGNMSAKAGHIVYAGMGDPTLSNAFVKDIESFIEKEKLDMRPVTLNVVSEDSLTIGIDKVLKDVAEIDILIHNAGHMSFAPSGAFTPEQLMSSMMSTASGPTASIASYSLTCAKRAKACSSGSAQVQPEATSHPTWALTVRYD